MADNWADSFSDASPKQGASSQDWSSSFQDATGKQEPLGITVLTGRQQDNSVGGVLDKYLNQPLAGVGEAAMSMGSGLAASALGGLGGMLGGGADTVRNVQEALTYQPRTATGKSIVHIAGIPFEIMGEAAGKGLGAVSELQGRVLNKLGMGVNPEQMQLAGEAIGQATIPVASTLLAGKAPLQSVATTKFTPPSIPKNMPIVTHVAEGLRDVARSRGKGDGTQALAEEWINTLVTPAEKEAVISALERRGSEVVPGSPVTSADAIARANREAILRGQPERFGGGVVKAQEGLAAIPETSPVLTSIKLQQEQARANVAKQGAGTEPQYAAAEAVRSGAANATYKPYGKKLIEGDAQLSALLETPSVSKAMDVAERIAAEEQVPFKIGKDIPEKAMFSYSGGPATIIPAEFGKYPLQNLQHIKMALDKMISKPTEYGIASTERGAMIQTRGKLIDWIEKKSPAYEAANMQYAIDSLPINQMDTWRLLQSKAISSTGKETPGSLLTALQDQIKIVRQATGLSRKDGLSDIFDTKNNALAARLAAEMEMELVKNRMAGEINVPGVGKAAEGLEPKIPNLLWRPSMIANFLIRHLAKDANVEVNVIAARILANPQMTANVLKLVKPAQRQPLLMSIKETATMAAANQQDQQ